MALSHKNVHDNNIRFYSIKINLGSSFEQKFAKTVSEYDQEIPKSQTADKPMAP